VAVLAMGLNLGLLWLYYRRRLPDRLPHLEAERRPIDRGRAVLLAVVTLGIAGAFFAGLHMGYATLAGVSALVLADRKDLRPIFAQVDWPLLVFFCSLFVVVAALGKTGLASQAWSAAAPDMDLRTPQGLTLFSALMAFGSNLFSNVPMVLLTGPHLGELGFERLGWLLLAFTTTVAGNLTLLGSVANIIVSEGARGHYHLGFWEYLRFGFVSTVLVLAAGVPLLWLLASRLHG
jgi:Na+/H+ antiporter NhaD/arsenite permease-like protein